MELLDRRRFANDIIIAVACPCKAVDARSAHGGGAGGRIVIRRLERLAERVDNNGVDRLRSRDDVCRDRVGAEDDLELIICVRGVIGCGIRRAAIDRAVLDGLDDVRMAAEKDGRAEERIRVFALGDERSFRIDIARCRFLIDEAEALAREVIDGLEAAALARDDVTRVARLVMNGRRDDGLDARALARRDVRERREPADIGEAVGECAAKRVVVGDDDRARPCSPARAASMEALSAKRFVCAAMARILPTNDAIFSDASFSFPISSTLCCAVRVTSWMLSLTWRMTMASTAPKSVPMLPASAKPMMHPAAVPRTWYPMSFSFTAKTPHI